LTRLKTQKPANQLISRLLICFELLPADGVRIQTLSGNAYPARVSEELIIIGILLGHLQIRAKLIEKNSFQNGLLKPIFFFSYSLLHLTLFTLFLSISFVINQALFYLLMLQMFINLACSRNVNKQDL
jgi:hypothetical protein